MLAFHSSTGLNPWASLSDDTLDAPSGYYAVELRIRFDNENAYTVVTDLPTAGFFQWVWFRNSLALIRKMTKHGTLLVEFNDGEAVDSFDLRGLTYQLSEHLSDCVV